MSLSRWHNISCKTRRDKSDGMFWRLYRAWIVTCWWSTEEACGYNSEPDERCDTKHFIFKNNSITRSFNVNEAALTLKHCSHRAETGKYERCYFYRIRKLQLKYEQWDFSILQHADPGTDPLCDPSWSQMLRGFRSVAPQRAVSTRIARRDENLFLLHEATDGVTSQNIALIGLICQDRRTSGFSVNVGEYFVNTTSDDQIKWVYKI